MSKLSIHVNPAAQTYCLPAADEIKERSILHRQLPDFHTTPLTSLPAPAAHEVRALFVKDESLRAGLPAYKILGASWATFRAICEANDLPLNSSLKEVGLVARQRDYGLFAATAGNHGRALARLAGLMGVTCHIFAASTMDSSTKVKIEREGASVTIVDGDYDLALERAAEATLASPNGLQIQDFAFDAYHKIPEWHADGYQALFDEVEEQLQSQNLDATHIVIPVGGGTLAHAAVRYAKSKSPAASVLAVEPEASACLYHSLQEGRNIKVPQAATIMGGMVSPLISPISWPILSKGIDTSVVITDAESEAAATYLHAHGIDAGPCGAGSFAGFQSVVERDPDAFSLTSESVVVIVSTDGQGLFSAQA